jgi:hypothetical protein
MMHEHVTCYRCHGRGVLNLERHLVVLLATIRGRPGCTAKELLGALAVKPRHTTLLQRLHKLRQLGKVVRIGEGTPSDQYRWTAR